MLWFSATVKVRLGSRGRGGVGGISRGIVTLNELPNSLDTSTVILAPPALSISGIVSMVTTPVTSPSRSIETLVKSEGGDVWR